MKVDYERLRGFLDCMHEEADERDKRTAAIRDIVKAAKDAGFDGKAIRKVFARERMDAADRETQDNLVAVYEGALGAKGRALKAIEGGAGVEEAAKANGLHRATLARARHVAKQVENATPHDPETGEITESSGRPVQGLDGAATAAVRPLDTETGEITSELEVDISGDDAGHRSEPSRPAEQSVNAGPPSGSEPRFIAAKDDAPAPIDLTIPTFLDRRRAAQ